MASSGDHSHPKQGNEKHQTNDDNEFEAARQVYAHNINKYTHEIDNLMESQDNQKEVVQLKEKLDSALNAWKDYLLQHTQVHGSFTEVAQQQLSLVSEKIRSYNSKYSEYQESCLATNSPTLLDLDSHSIRSKASSTASSMRKARLLELEAAEKIESAQLQHQQQLLDSQLQHQQQLMIAEHRVQLELNKAKFMREKARIMAEESMSSKGSSRSKLSSSSREPCDLNVRSHNPEPQQLRQYSNIPASQTTAPTSSINNSAKASEFGKYNFPIPNSSITLGPIRTSTSVQQSMPNLNPTSQPSIPVASNFSLTGWLGSNCPRSVPGSNTGPAPSSNVLLGNLGSRPACTNSPIPALLSKTDQSPLAMTPQGPIVTSPSPSLAHNVTTVPASNQKHLNAQALPYNPGQLSSFTSSSAQAANAQSPAVGATPCSDQYTVNSNPGFASKDDIYALYRTVNQGFNVPGIKVPKFDGNPTQYHVFIRTFDNVIGHNIRDPGTLLTQLIEHCTGDAREAIQHLALSDDLPMALKQARDILSFRFGNRSLVISAHINELTSEPNIPPNDVKALCKLASQMRNCHVIFSSWNAEGMLDAHSYLKAIFSRLPKNLQCDYVADDSWLTHPIPSFTHLLSFIEKKAYLHNTFYGRVMADLHSKPKTTQGRPNRTFRASSFATLSVSDESAGTSTKANTITRQQEGKKNDGDVTTEKICPCSNDNHALYRCESFLKMDIQNRRAFITNHSLCFNCIKSTKHIAKNCPSHKRCLAEGCRKTHHTLLHLNQMPTRANETKASRSNNNVDTGSSDVSKTVSAFTNVMASQTSPDAIRLAVVPVTVFNPDTLDKVETYAFLDQGSTRSFIKSDVANKLCLSGPNEKCTVSTLTESNGLTHIGKRVSFNIKGTYESQVISVENALTLNDLPDLQESIPTNLVAQKYSHLQDLAFPSIDSEVNILIGLDVLNRYCPTERRIGPNGTPCAEHTVLGWTIIGCDPDMRKNCENVNFVKSISPSVVDDVTVCPSVCNHCKGLFDDVDVDPCATSPSIDDKKALAVMESTFKIDSGRITVGLPWKDKDVKLPNNFGMAQSRLNNLARKFKKDHSFYEKYRDKMQDLFDNQYAEIIPDNELAPTDKTWYLPHHATKQAKFRVVMDTSAEHEGTSLCKALLTGPDNNNSLCGVLMRFRRGQFAFSCDISSMYHRILVPKGDADAFRFLWFPQHDYTKPPIQCRMRSLIFGANSSPSIAIFALRKLADLNLSNSNNLAIQSLRSNFYVDDGLMSCDSIDDAKTLVSQLVELLSTGGFVLTKFLANDSKILQSLPEKDKLPAAHNVELGKDAIGRTLGITWNAKTDEFVIQVNVKSRPATRRGMLSEMAQVFDPLGLIQFCILPARRILQDICTSGCDWDEPVDSPFKERWEEWTSKLEALNGYALPRCIKPCGFEPVIRELHVFSDASSYAYGVCAYLRLVDKNGTVHCTLLRGTSRVNPKKVISIPRLELTAAVAAAQLGHNVKKELDMEVDSMHFHTDSTTVLLMINNTATRFKILVANRLNTIHLLTSPEQWHHVGTKENPADIGSRGLAPDELPLARAWFRGPEFLHKTGIAWPTSAPISGGLS